MRSMRRFHLTPYQPRPRPHSTGFPIKIHSAPIEGSAIPDSRADSERSGSDETFTARNGGWKFREEKHVGASVGGISKVKRRGGTVIVPDIMDPDG